MKVVDLARMEKGRKGVVQAIDGGPGLMRRLQSLGIQPGSAVTKVSSMFGRGPVVLLVHGTEVAVGYGVARKIKVALNSEEQPK